MEELTHRDISLIVLAEIAAKCEKHAMLAVTFTDPDKRAFHQSHAAKHSANAFTIAREWWKAGETKGIL